MAIKTTTITISTIQSRQTDGENAVGWLRFWLAPCVLLVPSLAFAVSGLIHLDNGLVLDSAFPVPLYLDRNVRVPNAALRDGVKLLRKSNLDDGNSQIAAAETGLLAGDRSPRNLQKIETGLASAPASAEGWVVYAEALRSSNPAKAGEALDHAFILAPYDYFWAARRALLFADLWDHLSPDTRIDGLQQAKLLWEEPLLHYQLMFLLAAPGGTDLLTRAYADKPDTIRVINRWIMAQRRPPSADRS
jgi:hypothetical protein